MGRLKGRDDVAPFERDRLVRNGEHELDPRFATLWNFGDEDGCPRTQMWKRTEPPERPRPRESVVG
jgi:hypothetical protein